MSASATQGGHNDKYPMRCGQNLINPSMVNNQPIPRQTDTRLTASFVGNLGKPAPGRLNHSGF